jgi:hypothetical protein
LLLQSPLLLQQLVEPLRLHLLKKQWKKRKKTRAQASKAWAHSSAEHA